MMLYGQLVGKMFFAPTHMGVWSQGERTEPFFLWAYEVDGEFKGNGVDVEGNFKVEGRTGADDIMFKKIYIEDGPNNKAGFSLVYVGMKVEGTDFAGGYHIGESVPMATNPDGHFILERYRQSETLDYIVDNLQNKVLRRKR